MSFLHLLNRKNIVLIVFYLCCLTIADAQDSIPAKTKHSISIETGSSRQILRDEVASPLLYHGTTSPLLLEYEFNKSKNRHAITFFIGNTKLGSSNTDRIVTNANYAVNLNALLSYSYSRSAGILQHRDIKCYWGFTFFCVVNYRNLYLNKSSNIPFFEQINNIGVNFLIEKSLSAKKHDFVSLKINLPLVAFVVLNDRYNAVVGKSFDSTDSDAGIFGQVIKSGEFVSFNKYFEFRTELSYSRLLTEHIGVKLEHQLQYYSISHYRNLLYTRYLSNQYLTGLFVTF
jgi:hypothetical protein